MWKKINSGKIKSNKSSTNLFSGGIKNPYWLIIKKNLLKKKKFYFLTGKVTMFA